MSAHPGASFAWSLRHTASSAMHIWGTKLHVILHWRLHRQMKLMQWVAHRKLHDVHSHIVPFRVLCAIRTQLWSCWWFRCTLFANYLLWGHWVTVNMTWVLFRDKMQKHSKECPSPSLAGVPPMGALSWDYGTSLLFSSSSWYSFWL